ncbi:MAG: hypothetical protein DRO73_00660 [Candidatus Thorarchaeota archaeon]|nr:MAG: hypothetical protein DRO73_00660 [Candidatus Thorarchaeota archaeon]
MFLVTSEQDEKYWLGVRDALRMVDSFIEWAKRNPDRAKPLDQFINDALIAAARRCQSCLSHALGISFAATESDEKKRLETERPHVDFFEPTETMVERSPLARTLRDPDDLYMERTPPATEGSEFGTPPAPPVATREEGPQEVTSSLEESAPSPAEFHEAVQPSGEPSSPLDSLEPTGSLSEEDVTSTGPPRDFESEFHLEEPEPLSVEPETPPDTSDSTVTFERVSSDSLGKTAETEPAPSSGQTFASPQSREEQPPVTDSATERPPLAAEMDALAELERVLDEHGFGMPSDTDGTFEPSLESGPSASEEISDQESRPHGPSESSEPLLESQPSDMTEETQESTPSEPLVTPPPTEESPPPEPEEVPLVTPPPLEHQAETTTETETTPATRHSEVRSLWSPYDEPSAPESSVEPSTEREETPSDTGRPDDERMSVPPPPPPPPDTDETEEERQKRTRRLFFGA